MRLASSVPLGSLATGERRAVQDDGGNPSRVGWRSLLRFGRVGWNTGHDPDTDITMMRTRRSLFGACLLALAGAGLITGTASAQPRSGFYLSQEIGLNLAPGVELLGNSNDRASRCDEFINPRFAALLRGSKTDPQRPLPTDPLTTDSVRRPTPPEPYRLGDLTIDYEERRVTVAGRPVPLTVTEYDLLRELSVNAGRVLTHADLLRRVWGPQHSGDARLVRAFVKKLRRKLGDAATRPAYIVTEPRVGYRMTKAVSREGSTG